MTDVKNPTTKTFWFWVRLAALWCNGVMFGLSIWLAYEDGLRGNPEWHSQAVGFLSLVGAAAMLINMTHKVSKE